MVAAKGIGSKRGCRLKASITTPAIELALLVLWATRCFGADAALWDAVVKEYVNSEARVEYARLRDHGRQKLDAYVTQLSGPADLSKAELINAYNALTVRWILDNYPVKSIWRTSHPFTEARHVINGEKVSLDTIESRLRKMGDPRIHGALVCAARSCPPLRSEAYTTDRVDAQLDDNVRRWLANEKLNQFLPARRTAQVSMIFKWYAGDFGSVENFLIRYAPVPLQPGLTVKHNEYHWGLNDSSELGADYGKVNLAWDHWKNN